jgi:site-specific recombinase
VARQEQRQAQTERKEAMSIETLLNLLPSLLAAVGVWVSLNSEVAKLKGRVYRLESDQGKIEAMLKECVEGIQELKLLLAKKGI